MPKHVCENCKSEFIRDHSGSRNSELLFCSRRCYGDWQKGKDFVVQGKPTRPKKTCSVEGCESVHFGKGFCRQHYLRLVYNVKPRLPRQPNKKCRYCGREYFDPRPASLYCSMDCSAKNKKKPFIIKKGYKKILLPTHPRADTKGYVLEHIVIIEAKLDRSLKPGEEVHHQDRNKLNNAPGNLVVFASHAEHMAKHRGHLLPPHDNE